MNWSGLMILALLLVPAGLAGQAGRTEASEGNRLYREGRFGEAHERYLEALREAPDSPIIRFNDGNALYQGSDYEQSMAAYQDAVESGDPGLLSEAWYNIGNVLYRQQQLPQSLEAFKQALRIDPNDGDAKHNLERVLEQMQNPEQDQNQQNEDENQQDQDNENQDQQDQQDENQDQDQDDENQDQDQDENQDDENQDQNENDENQDESEQDQPQDPGDPEEDEGDGEPPPGQQGSPPPEMSREQAERLLEAIQEDQDEVNRQPRAAVRGRRPRKDW